MFRHLRSAVVAVAGLGAVAVPAATAQADDWHRPARASHHSHASHHDRQYTPRPSYHAHAPRAHTRHVPAHRDHVIVTAPRHYEYAPRATYVPRSHSYGSSNNYCR